VDTIKDLEILYADLPMEEIPWSPNLEGAAPQLLAMHIAATEKLGIERHKLTGTIANDPLAHSIGKGYFLLPLQSALRLATDCTEFCLRELPRFYPTNLKGGLMWEQGATPDQEIGYCFAMAVTYIQELLRRGFTIDQVAPRFTFFIGCGHQLFEEVAKFRAARRLWARLMRERFGATDPASMMFRFTTFVCGSFYQTEWPELNLVRGAYAALAGALAGTQGMLLAAWDEPFAIPTERSHALALGTQQICAEEIGVTKTVDPLGGSYYVEALTSRLEKEMLQRLREIEEYGGVIKAIEEGYLQRQLLVNYYRRQQAIESGEKVIVRKNKYVLEEGQRELQLHKHDPQVERKQVERLREVRARRDNSRVQACLEALQRAAQSQENLMPYLIEAARAYASIGEMTRTLKEVLGEFKEPIVI
jgi:methylmalonyl-CoA mutase N-terminal domain/subunit